MTVATARLLATLFAAALLLAACDGSTDPPATPTTPPTSVTEPAGGPPLASPAPPTPSPSATSPPAPSATPPPDAQLPIIDMHFHPDPPWDLAQLVALMDELGVKQAVGGSGDSGATAPRFAAEHPGRFLPFAGQDGMRALNLLQGAPSWNLETAEALAYVDSLEAQLEAGCWAGIGEVFVNTLGSHVSGGFSVPADSPMMRRLLDLAAAYGTPLSVHMDAAPGSVAELERLLDSNPDGAFIWAHAGWYATPAQLRDLIEAHPNLYLELSFRDELRSFYAVTEAGVLRQDWRALLEEMAGRIVLGTDLNPPPTPQNYADLVLFWRGVLDQLSPGAAALLAHGTAEGLLDGTPIPDANACIALLGG